jgi:DNA polymerase III gamma/tau subunit
MRDALTLLEQHIINSEVSTEYVRSSLSLLEDSLIEEVILTLRDKNIEKILDILTTLRNRHIQVRGFFDQILYALRDKLFASIHTPLFHEYEAIFAIFESAYSKIRVIPDSLLLIEITLIRAVKRGNLINE